MKSKLFGILLLVPAILNAQDIIVMKNGDLIQSKVLGVTQTEIKYRKFSNLNGPLYTIDKATVLSINYENGEKDSFIKTVDTNSNESTSPKSVKESAPSLLEAKVDTHRNLALVEKYNRRVEFRKAKEKKNNAQHALLKYGITNKSILSNEDVEIRINFHKSKLINGSWVSVATGIYSIELYNKTSQTIYVDLGNTFRIYSEGTYQTYFDGKQVSVSNAKGSDVGIALGSIANVLGVGGVVGGLASGISVGGSNFHSVHTTYNNQRIVSIPPHAWGSISKYSDAGKEGKYKVITPGEDFSTKIDEGFINKGGITEYTEQTTPITIRYVLTYSKDMQFSTFLNIGFELYLQQVFGNFKVYNPARPKYLKWENVMKALINDYGDGDGLIIGRGYVDKKFQTKYK